MSRWVGLREDQREGERLVVLVCELFASEPVGWHREQIESSPRRSLLRSSREQQRDQLWGRRFDLLAMRPTLSAKT